MTNFEFYTKNAARLGELIEKAVDDALEAKGCSLDLKYPEKLSNADNIRMVTWASWLNEEMQGRNYERYKPRKCAYLDTGMTPEAFQSFVVFLQDLIGNQKASEALDRFRQLVKADKDGRLLVLPVRPVLTQSIGSMLYIIKDGEIAEDSLCEALVGMGSNGEINIFYTTLSDQISFEQADIGKTVFLTREAAEKALETMKDGNG